MKLFKFMYPSDYIGSICDYDFDAAFAAGKRLILFDIDKTMKVGAAVVTCRRGGNTASYDVLNKYFSISSMPIATSQYWNMVYGGEAEEVLKDAEGLQTMRTLGKNIAFMAKSFALGKEKYGLPEKETITFTNFASGK